MALTPKTGNNDYEIVDAGLHKARLVRVIDQGTQKVTYQDQVQYKHKIMMLWELPETKMKEGEFKGKPFSVAMFPTLSLHKKSQLRPLLVGWRGKDFTMAEELNFNVLDLLDKTFLINIVHNTDGDTTYANIGALMPLAESECPDRVNDLVAFDLSEFDQKVFDGLSDKMKHKIEQSSEWPFRFNTQNKGEIAQAKKQVEDELPSFDEPEIDIEAIGEEGARGLINFEKEYKALKPRTWTNFNELCKRKMGDADYKDFFTLNEYGNPDTDTYAPEIKMKISKELLAVCKNRE